MRQISVSKGENGREDVDEALIHVLSVPPRLLA
jgi:hypothetical protein